MASATPLTYYDKILAGIALSLISGGFVGLITDLRLRVGLLAGALVATTLVYHALFRNPPLEEAPSPRAKAAGVIWHIFLLGLLGSALL